MDIVWLDQEECQDRTRVGGKAANLSRLAASHRVPPGFCVTAAAYERWGGDRVPAALHDALVAAYAALGERCGIDEPSVAVRSSALDEDGGTASFAGQHETYLNIVGALEVADAVARCWASARSERALEYRRWRGLSGESRQAVLIQQLVPADVSAVVFSANPVSGSRDEVMINTSWGLGESIVGGTVTPDTWTVRKHDLGVAARHIADKHRMTIRASGGTREVDVPRPMRAQPAIDETKAIEMARLALALERDMGWPVDIECAWNDGRLYLLQCRPITTLRRP